MRGAASGGAARRGHGGELAPLKLERAVFSTVLSARRSGADRQRCRDLHRGDQPGRARGATEQDRLGRGAVALPAGAEGLPDRDDSGLTMIFDEIDRGVGGATADAVGRRLGLSEEGGQVLVVTHSPQVAALGAHHWRVSKAVADGRPEPGGGARKADGVDEVARMLSGDTVTAEARAAARYPTGSSKNRAPAENRTHRRRSTGDRARTGDPGAHAS
jgi:DNA repair protein RecN (Recombination protein N)